jgi:hypothetical protein
MARSKKITWAGSSFVWIMFSSSSHIAAGSKIGFTAVEDKGF